MTSGRPRLSQTACSLEFRPPLVRPIRRRTGPFSKKGLRPRGASSDAWRQACPPPLAALARQFGENLVEHAHAAPANELIVDRLVRARIATTQPVLDHIHDGA